MEHLDLLCFPRILAQEIKLLGQEMFQHKRFTDSDGFLYRALSPLWVDVQDWEIAERCFDLCRPVLSSCKRKKKREKKEREK